MDLKELTIDLCNLSGPSGFEDPVFEYVAGIVRPLADEVRTDALGNLLAVKRCGLPGARTILLEAHMDEIGFIVTDVEDGFLRFASLGGVDQRMLPAREVRVLADPPVFGVVAAMPPHALKKEDMDKSVEEEKLRIDIGMSQEEAARRVPLGTPVVYAAGCTELGRDQLCGKALDNRACAAIATKAFEELSRRELSRDVILLLSTQEELGGRGVLTGAYSADPDYAVVVDTTHARTPDSAEMKLEMGKGAAIGVGPSMNRVMTKRLFELAEERGIPVQTEVCPRHSGTDADELQVSRAGVATALVSLPIKYMHTPVETARLDDMESVLRLIVEFIAEGEV